MTEREATDWDERLWEAAIDLGRLARDRMGEAGDLITPADLRRLGLGMAPEKRTLTVKVDVDTETDRIAIWKDGIGWVEMDRGWFAELLRRAEAPDAQRLREALEDAREWFASRQVGLEVKERIEAALASPPDAAGTVERCGAYGQDDSQGCPATESNRLTDPEMARAAMAREDYTS